MAKEFINGLAGQPTKGSLTKEKWVDKAFIFFPMAKNIKEAFIIINSKEKESINGRVEKYLLVNIHKV